MELFINNHASKPIYEQISDQIKALIMSGELQSGEAIPSIRSMAKSLHISVLTVQKAYDKLQADGFIETTGGKAVLYRRKIKIFIWRNNKRRLKNILMTPLRLLGQAE